MHVFIVRYILSPLLWLYRKCCHHSRGTTVNAVPIPAITTVSVMKFNRGCHNCGSTVVPIPVQLSSMKSQNAVNCDGDTESTTAMLYLSYKLQQQ